MLSTKSRRTVLVAIYSRGAKKSCSQFFWYKKQNQKRGCYTLKKSSPLFREKEVSATQHRFCHTCFLINIGYILWNWKIPIPRICSFAVIVYQVSFHFGKTFFLRSPFLKQTGHISTPSKWFVLEVDFQHFGLLLQHAKITVFPLKFKSLSSFCLKVCVFVNLTSRNHGSHRNFFSSKCVVFHFFALIIICGFAIHNASITTL